MFRHIFIQEVGINPMPGLVATRLEAVTLIKDSLNLAVNPEITILYNWLIWRGF